MKRLLLAILFLCLISFLPPAISAFEITSDPQYVVMNFSTITDLNWAAPETEWQQKIKPQVIAQITEMRNALAPTNTNIDITNGKRLLAWSTLMEYMNTPLDTPGPTSPYAIKMRRILEITDEQNLPLFVPLNGYQWLDELPELYNWWDPDGTHTDPQFFARQKNPIDFKQRFIAGYNPDNKWNVEWQTWSSPMKLNVRNWGGGGFRLAPPPALSNLNRTSLTYRSIQKARLTVILDQLKPYLQKWESEGRSELFAGLSIGTEVSLNASVTASDEFIPYGYRDVQDLLCPLEQPTCGNSVQFSATQISEARQQSIENYFTDLARFIQTYQIPKQRIYTHVWSESLTGDPRYENYAVTAFNLYSRAGMSFYGFANDPLSHPDWSQAVKQNGNGAWGAVEYSAGTDKKAWAKGLTNTFNNSNAQAKLEVTYNWDGHKDTGAIPALKAFIQAPAPVAPKCALPEILPGLSNGVIAPPALSWTYSSILPEQTVLTLHIKSGAEITPKAQDITSQTIPSISRTINTPELKPGVYSWYVEASSCNGYLQNSEPRSLVILPSIPITKTPSWVTWVLQHFQKH